MPTGRGHEKYFPAGLALWTILGTSRRNTIQSMDVESVFQRILANYCAGAKEFGYVMRFYFSGTFDYKLR